MMKSRLSVFTILIMLSVFFAASVPLEAQVITPSSANPSFRENVFGLGMFGGASGGLGLSFRHHLPAPLSYTITGGILKVNGRMLSDIGGELQYDLARGGGARFYVSGGFGYYFSGKNGNNEMSSPTRGGLGIGGEWLMSGGLHFMAEGMFTFFSDGNIFPLPQVGVYYYF